MNNIFIIFFNNLSFYLFLPELFLFIFFLFFFILLLSLSSLNKINFKFPKLIKLLLIFYIQIIFYGLILFFNNISNYYIIFYFAYLSNNFIVFLKIIFLLFFFFYLITSYDYLFNKKIFILEYIYLLTISILSCILSFSSNDFLILYLLLELQNICVYILINLKRNNSISIEAAIKYFIISSVMMALFLYGISLCYFSVGTINFFDFEIFLYNENYDFFIFLGFFFIFMSLLVKNGVPPFHIWLINVYSGCSLYILFYFLIFLKFFYFSILFRLYIVFFELVNFFLNDLIILLSLFCVFYGVWGALYQIKISRLFIFSSILNSSFFLFLFILEINETIIYFFYFSFFYLLNMFGIYIILSNFVNWIDMKELNKITNLINLGFFNFYFSVIISIFMLNFSGFPTFIGFFYKFFILNILMNLNLYLFTIILILFFTLSFFYYVRIIKIMFLNKNKNFILIKPVNYFKIYFVLTIILINIYYIFFQNFILNLFFECLI